MNFFSNILNSIINIDWNPISSMFLGAAITGVISYILTKRREKEKLIKDLQIKTADEMIDIIYKVQNAISSLIDCVGLFEMDILPLTNDIGIKNKEKIKEKTEEIGEYIKHWSDYQTILHSLIFKINSRKLILNGFYDFIDCISQFKDDIHKAQSKFIGEFFNCLDNKYDKNELDIESDEYKRYTYEAKVFSSYLEAMINLLNDFNIQLQNRFLSKVFGYKVKINE